MANNLDLALMSANVYEEIRRPSNVVGVPDGWIRVEYLPDDPSTGFSAGVFRNQASTETVIAYTGTNQAIDHVANVGLGLAGTFERQLEQAASFYLRMHRQYGGNITLTGHSLGGGLAALIGTYFNQDAVTFDAAPFRRAVNVVNKFLARWGNQWVHFGDFEAAGRLRNR